MVRKIMIAGNWKMNCLQKDGEELAKNISLGVKKNKYNCDFLVCPPYTLLYSTKKALRGSKIALGAQDSHQADKGAHTGDVSPQMLKDIGCEYTILGHSERRTDHHESNALVAKKAQAAYNNGLKTVICVGETAKQREEGKTLEICAQQVRGSMPKEATASNTIIAYEPVWAIGTGKTPTAKDVEEVHAAIRQVIAKKFGTKTANNMRILYGGSVKPSNAKEFLSLPDVDGALIGGASLKAEDFLAIAKSVC